MGIFKKAHARGINHQLILNGMVSYPSEKIADEVADAVADNLPDEVIPEMTDESGLTAEEAQAIIQQLAEVSEAIAEKTGGYIDPSIQKVAGSFSLQDAAWAHATALVKRAMEEGSTNPGQGAPQTALTGAEAQIDAINNPSSAYVGPQGSTSLDATPGMVGHQELASQQPGTIGSPAPESMADVKISALLRKLSGDGTLPSPTGARLDLNTNAVIPGAVVPQGMTRSVNPSVPVPLRKHPAAPASSGAETDMQEDVKQAASALLGSHEGRQVLAHLQAKQANELRSATSVLSRALGSLQR